MEYDVNEVYERAKRCRDKKNISYSAMARAIFVSEGTMNAFTGSKRKMTQDNLKRLSDFLEDEGFYKK